MRPNLTLRNHLFGLVLAGGQSQRMLQDKGSLCYRPGIPQRAYCRTLLASVCQEVYLSYRKEQLPGSTLTAEGWDPSLRIADDYSDLGPAAGLLSAHHSHPEASWFVVACDLPNVDLACVEFLSHYRNPNKAATLFRQPTGSRLLEPLLAIWEPVALNALSRNVRRRISSPRITLESLDCQVFSPPHSEILLNINTPLEAARFSLVTDTLEDRNPPLHSI